jgi:hypothetical protein
MMAIPLRMDEEVYCSEPVLTCVFNRENADVDRGRSHIHERGGAPPSKHDRILAVHDMIHNLYRPDMHLLPP